MFSLGIFGGTFDPVHQGHIQMAHELQQKLQLDQLNLMPCGQPAHRSAPVANAEHRLAMTHLAVADFESLGVDAHEVEHNGPSYTVETLKRLRGDWTAKNDEPLQLFWLVGMDSLVNLASWHAWRELFELANLIVVARPGWQLPKTGDVAEVLASRVQPLEHARLMPCGAITIVEQSLLPVSATDIRARLAQGLNEAEQNKQHLVPDLLCDSVWQYIQQQHLYRG